MMLSVYSHNTSRQYMTMSTCPAAEASIGTLSQPPSRGERHRPASAAFAIVEYQLALVSASLQHVNVPVYGYKVQDYFGKPRRVLIILPVLIVLPLFLPPQTQSPPNHFETADFRHRYSCAYQGGEGRGEARERSLVCSAVFRCATAAAAAAARSLVCSAVLRCAAAAAAAAALLLCRAPLQLCCCCRCCCSCAALLVTMFLVVGLYILCVFLSLSVAPGRLEPFFNSRENQLGDRGVCLPGLSTGWMFGCWFSFTTHGL